MLKPSDNKRYLLFGGAFVLANKLQFVGDKYVEGLSTKQWFLLRNLMDLPKDPPPTITQVAQEMDSTRQNITKMLEAMEREGFVVIEKSEFDQRSRAVCITAKGLQHTKQMTKNAQEFLNHLFQNIPEMDLEVAGKVLLQMMQNLETLQEEL